MTIFVVRVGMAKAADKTHEKAQEKVVLSRAELWMLRIAAATGVASFISHIGDLISGI
jgi:hypothetical protein